MTQGPLAAPRHGPCDQFPQYTASLIWIQSACRQGSRRQQKAAEKLKLLAARAGGTGGRGGLWVCHMVPAPSSSLLLSALP